MRDFGGPDAAARDHADLALVERGEPAATALLPLVLDRDPEIRLRAAHLILRARGVALPGNPFDEHGQVTGRDLEVVISPTEKRASVTEGDRQVRIVVKPGALRVEVAAGEHGRAAQAVIEAADPAALAAKNSEAAEVFARWGGGTTLAWELESTRLTSGTNKLAGPFARAVVDLGHRRFGELLPSQLEAAKLAPAAREAVLAVWRELEQATAGETELVGSPSATDDEINRALQRVFSATNRLRDELTKAGLPEPGGLLAPGSDKRLGAVFRTGSAGALTIIRLLPQYRGQRMGLAVGDQVVVVGGRAVRTVTEVRDALVSSPSPVTVVVLRAGQRTEVTEGR